eukprot:m.90439 g.90439  ORF g.90439 m.90439 type:complete len:410 (-) comp26397_c0_seq2:91-1320(-)
MRVVFFNIALSGHIEPTLAIVSELVKLNHCVTYFLTDPALRHRVEDAGGDVCMLEPMCLTNTMQSTGSKSMLDLLNKGLQSLPWLIDTLKMLKPAPSVVVYDALAVWGGWLSQIMDIPGVCSSSTFVLDDGEQCNITTPTENHLRAVSELSEKYNINMQWQNILTSYGTTNLVYTSRQLQPTGLWSSHAHRAFHFVGPMFDATSFSPSLKKEYTDFVTEFTQRRKKFKRVVYICMGTAIRTSRKFWKIVQRAFPPDSAVLLVCALGTHVDDDDDGDTTTQCPSAANVWSLRWVPQKALLGTGDVDVFVTHGGMNSIHESLWCAVPMLLIPHHGDQPYNANIVQDLGCGLMVDMFDVSVQGLATNITDLIQTKIYKEKALEVQRDLHKGGKAMCVAANIIIDVANRQAPQ